MAILSFKFILVAFLACFLRKEAKQALSSLFLEVLGNSNREVDSKEADNKVVNSKIAYGKNIGSRKVISKKVYGFLADFTLYIF